jgi:predicted DNA-binding ribbon-helix-helix protein
MPKPTGNTKRSLTVNGRSTSISLEEPFWTSLKEIAALRGQAISKLVDQIDGEFGGEFSNLSSAIRVYVLRHYLFMSALPVGRGTAAVGAANTPTRGND